MRKNKQKYNQMGCDNNFGNNEEDNGVDIQISEEENIPIRNRTYELESNKVKYQYYFFIVSKGVKGSYEIKGENLRRHISDMLKGNSFQLFNLEATPKEMEIKSIKEMQQMELAYLSICKKCKEQGLRISLEIWKKQIHNIGDKIFVGSGRFLPPFSLFKELEFFVKNSAFDNEENSMTTEEQRNLAHMLKEFKNTYDENNILSLDILKLRKNNEQLFWNLIYRFMQDKREYAFLIPYESHIFPDLENKEDDIYDFKNYKLETKKDEEEEKPNSHEASSKEVEKRLQSDDELLSQNNN